MLSINQKTPEAVDLSFLIFLYCLLALINTGRWGQWLGLTGKAASHFNWYINDITYAMRIMVVFLPLIIGVRINYDVCLFNRILFFGLIAANFATIIFDYYGPGGSNKFDDMIYFPKLVVIIWLLIFGKLLSKKHVDY